jgi:hypothetical protein
MFLPRSKQHNRGFTYPLVLFVSMEASFATEAMLRR